MVMMIIVIIIIMMQSFKMEDVKSFSFIRYYFAFEVENVNNVARELQLCSCIFQVQTNVE